MLCTTLIDCAMSSRHRWRFWTSVWVALIAASVASPAVAQQPAPLTSVDVAAFADSVLARYLRECPDPSLALAVVHGDSILFMKGYGSEDPGKHRPVDAERSLFNIASVSKLVTATAAMQLVEREKISLDADIGPTLGPVRIAGQGPPVTLRHLLTHTSGLEGPFLRDVVADPKALVPLGTYFAAYSPRRGRQPNNEIRYSNYGMALAGYLVERASGESFHDYVERHVFAPLGMTHSSFRQPPPAAMAARLATAGAGPVPDALLGYPAGAMVSSAADMARFMLAHLTGATERATRILADSTLRQMHQAQWRADPRMPGVGLGFFETTIGGLPGLFHSGARTHFSLLYLVPDRRIGIFLVHAQRQGGPFQTLRTDFVRAFAARYFPHAEVAVRHDLQAAERAAGFAGVYRPHLLPRSTIERAADLFADTRVRVGPEGSLDVAIPGGPAVSLTEVDSGLYRVLDGTNEGLTIAFGSDASRAVRRMALSGSTQDPVSFDRLAWHQRGTPQAVLLGVVFLLFSGFTLAELSGGALRRLLARRRVLDPPGARHAWRAAVAAGALTMSAPLSIAALVITHRDDSTASDGLRVALTVGLTFLLAGTAVGLALVPLSLRAWREQYWSVSRRVCFTTLAIGALIAAPLLWRYHLLGYWF